MDLSGLHFDTVQVAPKNFFETLSFLGMGTPRRRATLAFLVAAAGSYATKWPAEAFKDNGVIKRFDIHAHEEDEHRTQAHFVLFPALAAVAVYLFT